MSNNIRMGMSYKQAHDLATKIMEEADEKDRKYAEEEHKIESSLFTLPYAPYITKIANPPIPNIVFQSAKNKITINLETGNVEIEGCENMNDASKEFWRLVKENFPGLNIK